MTSFFVAGVAGQGKLAEAAYSELRKRSEGVVGSPARSRRIFSLSCRFDGRDCEIKVGRKFAEGSDVVSAILDHGREEAFVVHTDGEGKDGAVRVGRPVYAVTEFS
ncbi:MAG TPA: hypothetical protein VK672_05525 [Solirubrobacteraceae bacterium]|jgi:hypothetical protein|nr:hypothetical protein [Solirubrobacteraceae bacterium]